MTRREAIGVLSATAGSGAASPAAAFLTAGEAAAAVRGKKISSVELTRLMFERIDRYQPKLNAYVYQMREQALEAAGRADQALARGQAKGALHGVPVNVKESFAVAGRPCTWGIPALKDTRAARNSAVVDRLLNAGAILLGATNVPLNLMDTDTFNDIYGVTNNPWDPKRTPGGSSGGSAASLAAGLAYLSAGSDIGGSIRTPAHLCGIYGHKPTLDVVSLFGHSPGGASMPGFSTLLAVAGPMARSAQDLEIAMKVLGGPEPPDSKALSWRMPEPRHTTLRDFRVGYVLDDPVAPVGSDVQAVLEKAVRAVEKAGAKVRPGWPHGAPSLRDVFETYAYLLGAFTFSTTPPEQQARERAAYAANAKQDPYSAGAVGDFASWQRKNIERLAVRAVWERCFESIDVFLSPVIFASAWLHDFSPPLERTIPTPEGREPFINLLAHICTATLTGCPATSAPAGRTASGLPAGIQILGPYMEDATPIRFAALLAREIGGFVPPPGYEV